MILYNSNLGLTIAIVDWEQEGSFKGSTVRVEVTAA